MKKILVASVLLVSVLGLFQAVSTIQACHKSAWLTVEQWPNGIVEVGEEVQWLMSIYVASVGDLPGSAPGTTLENIVVTDNLNTELELDQIGGEFFFPTQGYVEYYTTGKSEKVHLT